MTVEQYRCRDDGEIVLGPEGLRTHRARHLERGENVPEWEVASDETPRRTVRVPDELWAAATVRAAERGESVSDVVRRALARYARRSK